MKRIPFSKEALDSIKGCCVYLISYSVSYWNELCDEYDILPLVSGAFDSTARRQGVHNFRGKDILVRGLDGLKFLPNSAVLIITDDYFGEAYEEIEKLFCFSSARIPVYYFQNKETRYDLAYREKYKEVPLRDILLFRSGPHASGYVPGLDFADNARALFEYMLREGFDKRYELVWLVRTPEKYEENYKKHPNVRFLPYHGSVAEDEEIRDSYYETLCLAKYIFFTDAYGFARNARSDQVRVQLWHGCGIKRRVYFSPCERRYEYTTVISEMYKELHARDYGLRPEQVLVTGYPKNDWLFHPLDDWRSRLHVPCARKYIFWLPTFRTASDGLENLNVNVVSGETGLPIVHSLEMLQELNELLGQTDMILLIKLHPFQKRESVCRCILSNILFLENGDLIQAEVQINQLLGHADALISDYSSVAVDYTLLDRPIAFTLDDYEIYGKARGFNWPNVRDYLPGEEIFNIHDFWEFVGRIADDEDKEREKRQSLRHEFHSYFDDRNSARVLEALGIED